MQVNVANHLYQMGLAEYRELLKIASEQVPFGIYAMEKKGYAELRCDRCRSKGELKKLIRQFKVKGFRVLANQGGRDE